MCPLIWLRELWQFVNNWKKCWTMMMMMMMIGSHFCQTNNSNHANLWENPTIRKEKNKALNLLSHNPILTRNVLYYCTMTDKRLRPWLTFVCPLQNSFWIISNDCINSHSLIILHLKAFHQVTTELHNFSWSSESFKVWPLNTPVFNIGSHHIFTHTQTMYKHLLKINKLQPAGCQTQQ